MVGRRLWRRRIKKRDAPTPKPTATTPGLMVPAFDDSALQTHLNPPVPGALVRLRAWLRHQRRELRADTPVTALNLPAHVATDAVGEVLSVPRGVARLDAFEHALSAVAPASAVRRDLAIAFHRELTSLSESAGVDLSLLGDRVQACADALVAAGEDERAGSLFLRLGSKHQAAEMFIKTGAVEQLQETYALIEWDEGGPKLDARLAFERFEALFVVGMRDAALLSLERAIKLWGDNPVYNEVHRSFLHRIGVPFSVFLRGHRAQLRVVSKWPLVIGRGDDAAVRLQSPLLSRAHVQVALHDGVPTLIDLDNRGGTRVNGVDVHGPSPLRGAGEIEMGGVAVAYAAHPDALSLWPSVSPDHRTLAPLRADVTLPTPTWGEIGPRVRIDARGRTVGLVGAQLNGEVLKRDTVLLEGDRLGAWVVARP